MPDGVALFGGSFDPIHHGHLIIARSVAEKLALDRVVFLPSGNPPHKPTGLETDIDHRIEMVRLAIADEPRFALDEFDARRDGPTYTIDTIHHFSKQLYNPEKLFWIIGADSLVELATWHRVADLVDVCQIVTAVRPGWTSPDLSVLKPKLTDKQIAKLQNLILETPHIDISATDIRKRTQSQYSINYLVPDAVRQYIIKNGLYRDKRTEPTD